MRIVVGLLFACHGAQKLLAWFPKPGRAATPLDAWSTVGGAIELVGGLLIAVGLFTWLAAFIASGMMAVAYFKFHFPQAFMPIQNGGELAVVYCFVFLYMFFRGSGPLSVDSLIFGRGNPAPDEVGGPMRTGRTL